MNDDERDILLIQLDTKMDGVIKAQEDLKCGLYGKDGQGGLCARVTKLEAFQSNILSIVATVTIALTLAGNWILSWLPKGGN